MDRMNKKEPNLYIIAGPNGAGKTTFARKFLPDYVKCLEFINADLIAGGLSPFVPERAAVRAGRIMMEQIHSLSAHRRDFGFETTLSGKTYVKLFKELKNKVATPISRLNVSPTGYEEEDIAFQKMLSGVVLPKG